MRKAHKLATEGRPFTNLELDGAGGKDRTYTDFLPLPSSLLTRKTPANLIIGQACDGLRFEGLSRACRSVAYSGTMWRLRTILRFHAAGCNMSQICNVCRLRGSSTTLLFSISNE